MLTLERLEPTGDAEVFLLTDGVGYERRFVVSACQMAVSDDAVTKAIRHAVADYWQTNPPQ